MLNYQRVSVVCPPVSDIAWESQNRTGILKGISQQAMLDYQRVYPFQLILSKIKGNGDHNLAFFVMMNIINALPILNGSIDLP